MPRVLTLTVVLLGLLLLSTDTISQESPQFGHPGEPGSIQTFALSDDGRLGVVADYDGRLLVLNLRSGQIETLVSHYPYAVNDMKISPRSDLIAIADIGRIRIVSISDARSPMRAIDLGSDVSSDIAVAGLSFSPKGDYLAAISEESSSVVVWDVAKRAEYRRLKPCRGGQQFTAFSNDGLKLAAVCNENIVRIWDLDTPLQVRDLSVGPDDFVNWIRFSRDGRRLFASTGGANLVQVFDLSTGAVVSTLKGHKDQVYSFAVQTNGLVITTSADETVRLWNIKTGKLLKTLKIPHGLIAADGSVVLAQAEQPGILELWDVRTGSKVRTFNVVTNAEKTLSEKHATTR